MIVGFLLWYVKVQLPLDREMMRSEKRLVGEEGKGEEDRRGGVLNDSH